MAGAGGGLRPWHRSSPALEQVPQITGDAHTCCHNCPIVCTPHPTLVGPSTLRGRTEPRWPQAAKPSKNGPSLLPAPCAKFVQPPPGPPCAKARLSYAIVRRFAGPLVGSGCGHTGRLLRWGAGSPPMNPPGGLLKELWVFWVCALGVPDPALGPGSTHIGAGGSTLCAESSGTVNSFNCRL